MRSSFASLLALLAATVSLQAPVGAASAAHPVAAHGSSFPPPKPLPKLPPGIPGGYRGPEGGRGATRPGAGPGAAGVPGAGPTRPTPGLPGPSTPGGTPLAPGFPGPNTLGADELPDTTSWRLWWEFNKDAYLRLGSLRERDRRTGDDDFFLGKGQRAAGPRWRVTQATVEEHIIPALTRTIRSGGDLALTQDTILALARASRVKDVSGLSVSLRWFLSHNDLVEIDRTATLAFGVLGGEQYISVLADLLLDNEDGRQSLSENEWDRRTLADLSVDPSVRAFAAYGLALLGREAAVGARLRAVTDLAAVALDAQAPDHLRAAAMLSLGFIRLPAMRDGAGARTLYAGEAGDAAALEFSAAGSLEAQVNFVLDVFMDPVSPTGLRAQAACAAGRLVGVRDGVPEELTIRVVEALVESLDPSQRQAHAVQECAVLGLTMIGDADGDLVDEWVRYALRRVFYTGGPLEKRLALIGMAKVASRAGQGSDAVLATDELRQILLHHMTVGRRSLRPWAALALGVLGHRRLEQGQATDEVVDLALLTAFKNARKTDEVGAYALALGMRRHSPASLVVAGKLERLRRPPARGYCALALGMIGERSAAPSLEALLASEETDPAVSRDAGLALGLLGEASAVDTLLELLAAREDESIQVALIQALGGIGNERAVDALEGLFVDKESPPNVRSAVAVALGRLADRERSSWLTLLASDINHVSAPPTLTNPKRTGVLDFQ